MNETIKKLTEQLKDELIKTPEVADYLAARDAYVADQSLISLVNEYNVQTGIYQQESQKPTPDTLLITSIKTRLENLYKQITENPRTVALNDKENDLNELYGEIMGVLQSPVVPEQHEHNCGGDCGSCGGCH